MRGKKVYDPRTDTIYWAQNTALVVADYLISSYGVRATSSELDLDNLTEAAEACGFPMQTAAGPFEFGLPHQRNLRVF